ncbi:MAG: 5'-3' exonuclease H3TH domain-containing protein [Candidatus Pacebacteria bacterium]|nr:5'-3' exonuclease H3TH domain-containing protein [Candidatus Paceibacterota bacterium]
MEKKNNFVIIDSNAVVHRAFHALPPLTRGDGTIVNAVYGFLLVLFKIIKEFNPVCIVACFDLPEPTFRKQAFAEYKAKRKKAPDELYAQLPMVKEALKAFNILILEKSGFEADDLIGTLSNPDNAAVPKNTHKIIVSGDLDNLQLVSKNTEVYFLSRGVKEAVVYDEAAVKERYDGLSPKQMVDLRALRGDISDNIPGVKGIGEKTAIELIKQYGTLTKVYKEAEKNDSKIRPAVREKLLSGKEAAILSYNLSNIDKNVPVDFSEAECEWGGCDKEKALGFLAKFGFKSLMNKIPCGENSVFSVPEQPKKVHENLKLW